MREGAEHRESCEMVQENKGFRSDSDLTPPQISQVVVVMAYIAYAVGTITLIASSWHVNWATKDSRLLIAMGLIAPILLGGCLVYLVRFHFGNRAALFTIFGCAIGHLAGLYFGFSFIAPICGCVCGAFVGAVLGVVSYGINQE
jgi:hypothetical protein